MKWESCTLCKVTLIMIAMKLYIILILLFISSAHAASKTNDKIERYTDADSINSIKYQALSLFEIMNFKVVMLASTSVPESDRDKKLNECVEIFVKEMVLTLYEEIPIDSKYNIQKRIDEFDMSTTQELKEFCKMNSDDTQRQYVKYFNMIF